MQTPREDDSEDMLRIIAQIRKHTEACCREGHNCKKPEKCRARCQECSADAKAAAQANSWKREKLATLILKHPKEWEEFQAYKRLTRG